MDAAPDRRAPIFVLRLQAKPGTNGTHALRALLKIALRRHGLKCLEVREEAS